MLGAERLEMIKWIKKLFHKHEWAEPLVVSDYGYIDMKSVERRKLPDRSQPAQKNDDMTGPCTVRDAAAFMFAKKSDVMEMYFRHEGKEWNVELRILRVEDQAKTHNKEVTGDEQGTK